MPCAAGQAVQRQAKRGDCGVPALLQRWRTDGGLFAHGFFQAVAQFATGTEGGQFGAHVVQQGVALRVIRRANVEAEAAAPRRHVDRAAMR